MSTQATVKERPILFSSPMVQAILSGRKSMTRRVVKGPIDFVGAGGKSGPDWNDPSCWGWADEYGDFHTLMPDGQSSCDNSCHIACPYGRPGDRLWVRETWALVHNHGEDGIDDFEGAVPSAPPPFAQAWYRAGHPHEYDSRADNGFRWRPSIHMPRWASRITLEITEVRVERLQDITEEDALADGGWSYGKCPIHKSPERSFAELWDSINGKKHPWASNCWVWVIAFRRLEPT